MFFVCINIAHYWLDVVGEAISPQLEAIKLSQGLLSVYRLPQASASLT